MENETSLVDDINKDLTFTPQRPRDSKAYTTPPGHRPGSSTTAGAKKKLSQIATDPNRCLVTLATFPVEHCHILPRATKLQDTYKLEKAWGIQFGHLNPQTTANVLYLTADMHAMFDRGHWALLPTQALLGRVTTQAFMNDGNNYATFGEPKEIFEYHFLPFNTKTWVFPRINRDFDGYKTYEQSFDTFPSLFSHVHPFFVICDVARKETEQRKRDTAAHAPELSSLRTKYRYQLDVSIKIYQTWLGLPKLESSSQPEGLLRPPTPHSGRTDSSGDTGPGSQHRRRLKRRNEPSGSHRAISEKSSVQKRRRETPKETEHGPRQDVCAAPPILKRRVFCSTSRPRASSLPTPEHTHNDHPKAQLFGNIIPPMEEPLSVLEWVAAISMSTEGDLEGSQTAEQALAEYHLEEGIS